MKFNPAKFLGKVAKTAGKISAALDALKQGPLPERWCPIDKLPMTKLTGYNDLWMCPTGHRFQYGDTVEPLPPKPTYDKDAQI